MIAYTSNETGAEEVYLIQFQGLGGDCLDIGAVRPLFPVRRGGGGRICGLTRRSAYSVNMAEEPPSSPVTIVVNWIAGLKP